MLIAVLSVYQCQQRRYFYHMASSTSSLYVSHNMHFQTGEGEERRGAGGEVMHEDKAMHYVNKLWTECYSWRTSGYTSAASCGIASFWGFLL